MASRNPYRERVTGGRPDYTHTESAAWYEQSADDEAAERYCPPHEKLFPHVQALEEDQIDVHLQNVLNAKLYTNREIMAFEWNSSIASSIRPLNANLENVIQSVCDSMVSRIGANRPKPTVVTRGADFDVYLRGRQLGRFVWGEFDSKDYYRKALRCFLDVLVYGTAFMKIDIDDNAVYMERVHPDEIVVDQRECVSGAPPMCMYQRKLVSRMWLLREYGDDAEITSKLYEAQDNNFRYTSYRSPADEQIVLIEAWKRETRPGAGDGRHVICTECCTLLDEPYKRDDFPFAVMRYHEPENGYYGRPLVTELMDYQIRLNELNTLIRYGQDLVCVPRLLIEKGSSMVLTQFDNMIAKLFEYRGTKPEPLEWNAFTTEIYNERDRIRAAAYEFAGLSQAMAQASPLSPGIRYDSSDAIREATGLQDSRLGQHVQEYERFVISCAKHLIARSAELYKDYKKTAKSFWRSGHLVEQIDWSQADLEADKYVLQISASSVVNMSPAARKDKLDNWLDRGIISLSQYHGMSGEPDLERLSDQLQASSDAIEYQISEMLKGKPMTPTPLDNVAEGIMMVNDSYNRLTALDTPARVLVLFRNWISIAKEILKPKPDPMAAAMAGPPGAGPMAPGAPMSPQMGAPAPMMAPGPGGMQNGPVVA